MNESKESQAESAPKGILSKAEAKEAGLDIKIRTRSGEVVDALSESEFVLTDARRTALAAQERLSAAFDALLKIAQSDNGPLALEACKLIIECAAGSVHATGGEKVRQMNGRPTTTFDRGAVGEDEPFFAAMSEEESQTFKKLSAESLESEDLH